MYQFTKRQRLFEGRNIAVGLQEMVEVCKKSPTEKVVILIGKKFYRPPLPSTYKGKRTF